MLTHFTWHQFLLIVATTGALYYLAVLLLYYREEARRFLSFKKSRTNLQAAQPIPPQVSIMGATSTEAAPLLSDAATIQVAPPQHPATGFQEPVPAVILSEVNPLLEMALEKGMGKADLLSLLRLVFARHTRTALPLDREAVSQSLLQGSQTLPFQLTADELASLWPEAPAHP